MNRRIRRERRDVRRQRRLLWLALVGILLLAAVLRFWRLDTLPPGLYHDEAYNGLDALALNAGRTFPLFYEGWELYAGDAHANRPPIETQRPWFFEGNFGREPLHVYLMALSIQTFGATPFAIRAVPAAAGVLAVLTTFLAALALFNNSIESAEEALVESNRAAFLIALLAALTMAILYPALTFSRFGIRAMLFVPLETLSIFAFWNAVQRPHDWQMTLWFVIAGLFLGAGIYTYAAARLLPLLFIIYVPLWFWWRPSARSLWPRIVLMGVAALLAAAPLLIFFARYPYFFVFRIGFVANKGLGTFEDRPWLTWLNNVWRVFRGLVWQGETHLRHNLPGRPYFDPIQLIFFLSGTVALARSWARPVRLRTVFLSLWFLVMLLPTILSGDAPHFGRMTGVAAPGAIIIGYGAVALWRRLAGRLQEGRLNGARMAATIIMLGFMLSGMLAVVDYFGRYAQHPELEDAFYLADWELGQAAAAEPADTWMFLSPTQEEMATVYFALNGERERMLDYYGPGGVVPAGEPGKPLLYFVRPDDPVTVNRLQTYFPDGRLVDTGYNALRFEVPPNAPRVPGIHPTDVAFASLSGETIALVDWTTAREQDTLFVTLYWQTVSPLNQNYTAYVHLLNGDGSLVTQVDRPPGGFPTSDWRTGGIVADQFALLLPADLPSGDYWLATGFYAPGTLEALGEQVRIGPLHIGGQD